MPRLPPNLLRRAAYQSPVLARLLRECRDLGSATNELRWLKEHAFGGVVQRKTAHQRLVNYVNRRSRGEPLQYILGTQPFGDLEILCRRNVLIPRPETEVYATKVAQCLTEIRKTGLLGDGQVPLRIADLCTGTGCISLLLYSLLCPMNDQEILPPSSQYEMGLKQHTGLQIHGFDISPHALRLAQLNISHNIQLGTLHDVAREDLSFQHLDVLALATEAAEHHSASRDFLSRNWDVIISNPPYISPSDFAPGGTTSRSVREYEPKLALVPPPVGSMKPKSSLVSTNAPSRCDVSQEDQFYHAILRIVRQMDTKLIVLEAGDSAQARRVRDMVGEILDDQVPPVVEIWRDDASEIVCNDVGSIDKESVDGDLAHERAVAVWRGSFAKWRRSKL